MADDGYSSYAWEATETEDANNSGVQTANRPHTGTESGRDSPASHQFSKPTSPQPRSSVDSSNRPSTSKWRDSATLEHNDTLSTIPSDVASLVETTFDENVLRALCDMDCSVPLLVDRIKQSMVSCREASIFFKKRATLEEEYGKALQKLARATADTYATSEGKAGTFVNAWQSSMRIHEVMAENRLRFAQRLNEMSEELANLSKEVEKNRKQTKDLATRYERALQESEMSTEKIRARLDITSEELERVLLQKEGESVKENAIQGRSPGGVTGKRAIGKAVAKGGLLLKGKNPGNIQRQEDDVRSRISIASDAYRKAMTDTQAIRQEYFNFQLPRILRALKECADEVDLGTQYHLTRYAFLFESIVVSDGSTLIPTGEDAGRGLKGLIEMIDNRSDFKVFMQNYAYAHGNAVRGPRRDGPREEGFLPPLLANNDRAFNNATPPKNAPSRPTFGVDLAEQMARDNCEVPPIMPKCCQVIEKYGLRSQGIYRVSGTTSKVAKLKEKLDKDLDSVNLDVEEWTSDINNVSSVLKLWLRELPDPLLTYSLQQGFIEASKIENDRLRHIRLHERVNALPDSNYSTLKFLMGHLHTINQYEAENSMTVQNLAIVFGPTLFGIPMSNGSVQMNGGIADTTAYQNKAIETILDHYRDIFVDEAE